MAREEMTNKVYYWRKNHHHITDLLYLQGLSKEMNDIEKVLKKEEKVVFQIG